MLRASKASDIANAFVDDGDDILITSSFRATEENSSVLGNASCFDSGFSEIRNPKRYKDDESSTLSVGSTDGMEDQDARDDQPTDRRGKFKLMRPLSFTKRPNQAARKSPWRLKTFLIRPRQSRAIREYQEMVEHDFPLSAAASDVASVAETLHSIRSCRINVATGKSLLVRQKAQVVGRPSVAQTDWDIGSTTSSYSSSVSSSAGSSGRPRVQRKLSWDNASSGARSDISQLTGDSFRSKRSDFTSSRAMYMNPGLSLLGTTEEEEEHDNEIENDENMAPNRKIFDTPALMLSTEDSPSKVNKTSLQGAAMKVVNRLLWETKNLFHELKDWDAFAPIVEESSESFTNEKDENRARVFSDSDFVFEIQRQRLSLDGCLVDEFGFRVPSPREKLALDTCRSRAYSDSFRPNQTSTPTRNAELFGAKPRCASENHVSFFGVQVEADLGIEHLEDFDFSNETCLNELRPKTVQSITTPPFIDPLKRLAIPFSHDRRKSQEDPESNLLSRNNECFKSHRRLSSNPELTTRNISTFGTPSRNEWWARVAFVTNDQSRIGTKTEYTTSAERTIHARIGDERRDVDPRGILQPVQRGLSSENAATAAKRIASALRPLNAAISLPVDTTKSADHRYYWNNDSEDETLEEVLWSLSADDSFENLF